MIEAGKTIGQISRETGVPIWKVRRVADAVASDVRRVGHYRLIDDAAEARIRDRLTETGWIKTPERETVQC